jgi:hypothetical protein
MGRRVLVSTDVAIGDFSCLFIFILFLSFVSVVPIVSSVYAVYVFLLGFDDLRVWVLHASENIGALPYIRAY